MRDDESSVKNEQPLLKAKKKIMDKTDLKELILTVEQELSDLVDLLDGSGCKELQDMIEAARREAERM